MSPSKIPDAAPPYEEIPPNPVTGYTPVSQADHDHDPEEYHHQHPHPPYDSASSANIPLVPPTSASEPHFHCEACDRVLERQQKRRSDLNCCALVAATFMAAFLCLLILGVVIVKAQKKY